MDLRDTPDDVDQCKLCNNTKFDSFCDICHVSLCKSCIGEHISDGYENHKIVSFQHRQKTLIYPKCLTHSSKTCKLRCEQCNVYICARCLASNNQKGHTFNIIEDLVGKKKKEIKKDAKELKDSIFPTYTDIVKDLENEIASLDGKYENLKTTLSEQGEKWHKEIDNIVSKMIKEIDDIRTKHNDIMVKCWKEIQHTHLQVHNNIYHLEHLENSTDVSEIMGYIPKNKEFRNLPAKVSISVPVFHPETINSDYIYKIFGSLKLLDFAIDENGYKFKKPEVIEPMNKVN